MTSPGVVKADTNTWQNALSLDVDTSDDPRHLTRD